MSANFLPAEAAHLDLLVRLMRKLYEHDRLPFDERIAVRALEWPLCCSQKISAAQPKSDRITNCRITLP